jgi:phospholipid/cholesterol/gamma-HCH transport system substrate-binding protein
MKKVLLTLAIAAIVLCVLLILRENSDHRLSVKTYFQNALDIRRGTAVWVDGVQVGSVADVRLRPELKERPVEISIAIRTPYELIIPEDSVARLETQTVLGPTVINIDTRRATGAAIRNNGVVKSDEPELSI